MNNITTKVFYWTTFALSLYILTLNVGIGLIAFAIVILPILYLHFTHGLNLRKLKNNKGLVVFSSLNLLAFTLVRPDGAHNITDNGLSAFLDFFSIHAGFNTEYENIYFVATFALFLSQLVVEITLWNLRNKASNKQLT